MCLHVLIVSGFCSCFNGFNPMEGYIMLEHCIYNILDVCVRGGKRLCSYILSSWTLFTTPFEGIQGKQHFERGSWNEGSN